MRSATLILISAVQASAQGCVNFPANLVPFSSISYVTPANGVGDHLVVGVPAPGMQAAIAANLKVAAFPNQTFCDSQVQLASQQYFSNVYAPTSAELGGSFSGFAGLLADPGTNQPYPGGVIPSNKLGNVFAWRIGPAQTSSSVKGWGSAGTTFLPRTYHSQILLPSGEVFVYGYEYRTEIFNPATGVFSFVGSSTMPSQSFPTLTLLKDGRVFVTGGNTGTFEIYDPAAKSFTKISSESPQLHLSEHTATLLPDGKVLIVGGSGANGTATGADIFDPKTNTFSQAAAMIYNRTAHCATSLPDGRVLITGGLNGAPAPGGIAGNVYGTAEIFDPKTGTFSSAGLMRQPRARHFSVLLSTGKVLLGGGFGGPSSNTSAELFDPPTGFFTATGEMPNAHRAAQAELLSSGQVLVIGGLGSASSVTNATDLYNPATGRFTSGGNLATARAFFGSTTLLDGRVLVTGGCATCGLAIGSAEIYTPQTQGLVTSQTGLTFRVAQGNTTAPSQTVVVLSATDMIPWSLSTKTFQGGGWLTASPSGNVSDPNSAPVTITVNVNPSGLAAQDYYGSITLTPNDGKHPPITIAVVLNIVPAGAAAPPSVLPGGLVFLTPVNSAGTPQSFVISNLTSIPLAFSATASGSSGWFDFNPKSATLAAGRATSITVTPSATAFVQGTYRGSIKLAFGDGSAQVVDLLLVVSSQAAALPNSASNFAPSPPDNALAATVVCNATKLLPVFTSLTAGFNTPAGWPSAVIVQVLDDCGNNIDSGSVVASFSNGDPPLTLISTGRGMWSGTWVPGLLSPHLIVRADASRASLQGSVQVTGQIAKNAGVPVVTPGGIVSTGDFTTGPALGLAVAIFGSGLADATAQPQMLPLPHQVGSTSVLLGSQTLPLIYVSDGLISAVIPYDVPVNTTQQLVVTRGSAYSVPVSIGMFDAAPVILATSGTGIGQAHAYKYDSNGNAILANAENAATAGDGVVIYAIGLGSVSPAVKAGDPSPSNPPSTIPATVTVLIGGIPAKVAFAGLTPTAVGLYQVNVTIPPGLVAGAQVPVTISIGAKTSSSATFMGIR